MVLRIWRLRGSECIVFCRVYAHGGLGGWDVV